MNRQDLERRQERDGIGAQLDYLIRKASTEEERSAAVMKKAEFEQRVKAEESVRRVTERREAIAKAVGQRFANASLDNFEIYHANQKPVVLKCREMAADMKEIIAAGKSLFFYGTVGVGKDHLLTAMLMVAAQAEEEMGNTGALFPGGPIKAISGRDVFAHESPAAWFKARVLAVSDPVNPCAQRAPWELAKLFDLVDAQYRDGRCTWITMNAQTVDEAKRQLSPPIFDRLTENAVVLQCLWPSYRQRQRAVAGKIGPGAAAG